MKLLDLNEDGIPDAITSSNDPYKDEISAYIGSRMQGKLSFEPVLNHEGRNVLTHLSGGNERTILVNNKDLPGLADIDRDGDVDLLTFNTVGTYVQYYKNISRDSGWTLSQPLFVLADECWGKFYEDGSGQGVSYGLDNQTCASGFTKDEPEMAHNGATLSLIDPDQNGVQDLLFGDPGSLYLSLLFNWGSVDSAFIRDQEIRFPDRTSALPLRYLPNANVLDLDKDGDQDVLVSPYFTNGKDVEVVQTLLNDNGQFSYLREHPLRGMVDLGSYSHPASIDYDGDGLQDLVLAAGSTFDINAPDRSTLSLYRNTGDGRLAFELVDSNWLGDILSKLNDLNFSPTFGDLDGDGDEDLMMGSASGKLYFLENTTASGMLPIFEDVISGYAGIDVEYLLGTFSNVSISDVDGDGLQDLLVGSFNGDLTFFRNSGIKGQPDFDPDPESPENIDHFGKINPTLSQLLRGNTATVVINIDGEKMIAAGDESGRLLFYSMPEPLTDESKLLHQVKLGIGQRIKPLVYDFNQDGQMDVLAGNKRGGISAFGLKTTTRTQDNQSYNAISITPNPVRHHLTIQNMLPNSEVSIFQTSGQLVFYSTSSAPTIDVSHLTTGCYLMGVKSELEQTFMIFIKE